MLLLEIKKELEEDADALVRGATWSLAARMRGEEVAAGGDVMLADGDLGVEGDRAPRRGVDSRMRSGDLMRPIGDMRDRKSTSAGVDAARTCDSADCCRCGVMNTC